MNDPPSSPGHRRAVTLMVGAALLWSIAGVFTRHVEAAGRWEATFWRSLFCALSMAVVYAALHRGEALKRLFAIGNAGLLSGALWSVMFTCFMLAITQTTVANTLVLTSVSPITASLFAVWLLKEKLPPRTVAVSLVALAGIAVMFGAELGGGKWVGNLIALAVPVCAGLNWTLMRKLRAEVDLAPAVLIGGVISALVTLPFALPFKASSLDLGILATLGAFQLAVPCMMAVAAAKQLSPTEVALLSLLETLFGPLWAWLGAGETPSRYALLGGAVVLVVLVFESIARGRARAVNADQPVPIA